MTNRTASLYSVYLYSHAASPDDSSQSMFCSIIFCIASVCSSTTFVNGTFPDEACTNLSKRRIDWSIDIDLCDAKRDTLR